MSFPAYEEYKDSEVAWVGEIPVHWECSRLKNIFELMKRTPSNDDQIVTAFRDGEVTLRVNRRVEGYTNAIQEHGYQQVHPNDLVIHAMDAFAGAIGVSDSQGKSTPVYSVCRQRRPDDNVYYFGRLLRYMALSGFINSLAKGIRERSTEFRWKESANIVIPWPPVGEQNAIAAFLDAETSKIDGLVSEQRRLIELLQEKRQAVISHAVTKGLNPDVRMKPSGIQWLGDVPEHWEVIKGGFIGALFGSESVKEDQVCEDGNLPFIKVGSMDNDTFEIKAWDWFVDPVVEKNYRTRSDYVVFPKRGAAIFLNKVNVIDRPSLIDPNLMGWEINERAESYFIAYLLKTRKLDELADVSTVPQINNKHIAPERFPVPPVSEQKAIVAYLNAETTKIDSLVAQAQRAIELLQERRTALISAAVTGKIDVRGYKHEEITV